MEPEDVSNLTPERILNINTPGKIRYPDTGIDASFIFDNFTMKLNSKGVNEFLKKELEAYGEAWENSEIIENMRNSCLNVCQFDFFDLKTEHDFFPL